MSLKPLLIFNPPNKSKVIKEKKPDNKGGFTPYGDLKRPGFGRQKERLEPQFKSLQKIFEEQRAILTHDSNAISPENAIVFELVGSLDDFNNAVRAAGMEWLGELEDEIEPDEDFYTKKKDDTPSDKPVDRRILLIMVDQKAINQLINFWDLYKKNEKIKLDHGLNKFKTIFAQLKEVRRWGIKDRLQEFGLLDALRDALNDPIAEDQIPFEIDLWYRENSDTRLQAQNAVIRLLREFGGDAIVHVDVPDIYYHGIIGRLPNTHIRQLVEHWEEALEGKTIELFSCQEVMVFRPLTQAISNYYLEEEEEKLETTNNIYSDRPLPINPDPIVCLVDGIPLANHRYLVDRLIIDDHRDLSSQVQAKDRRHGTQMASLIIHGDLAANELPLTRPLLVSPVLTTINGNNQETFPRDIHYLDLIQIAFRRIFDEELYHRIHVVNFSIGDAKKPFYNHMSPLARLLDWMSYKYNVLIIVSAGNYLEDIHLDIPFSEIEKLDSEKRQLEVMKSIQNDMRFRRILSPAEALNVLTVGALHDDESQTQIPSYIKVFDPIQKGNGISPISPLGYGYRRAIKPEIVAPGGRQPYTLHPHDVTGSKLKVNPILSNGLGQIAAAPGSPGNMVFERHTRGTSNAAALTTRRAAQLYEAINNLRQSDERWATLTDEYVSVLIKGLLVHGSSWGDREWLTKLWEFVHPQKNKDGSTNLSGFKEFAARYIGFGAVDFSRIIECTENRATLVGWGLIQREEAHEFLVPLPDCLRGIKVEKRLTTTLAWFSPVNGHHRRYRQAVLELNPSDSMQGLKVERSEVTDSLARRGTVQHEIFTGDKVAQFADDTELKLKVTCREDAGGLELPVLYSVIATLEAKANIPIYEDIRSKIEIKTNIRPQIAIR